MTLPLHLQGMVSYLFGKASSLTGALGLLAPSAAPLPATVTGKYQQDLVTLIRTRQGVANWPVVDNSQVRPNITLHAYV